MGKFVDWEIVPAETTGRHVREVINYNGYSTKKSSMPKPAAGRVLHHPHRCARGQMTADQVVRTYK